STSLISSSYLILRYCFIFNQVYLPMFIFPLSFMITQLFIFLFGLIVIAFFLLFFGVMPGWQIVFLPILIIVTLVFLLAIGLVLGYFTVFVRDIDNLLSHVIRVFFYASPIIWP